MEDRLTPFERCLTEIEKKVQKEDLPERLGKLPKNLEREAVASLTAISIIKEAIRIIRNGQDEQERQEEDSSFHLKYPFINHLVSCQLEKTEGFDRKKIRDLSTQIVGKVIRQLKDREFLQECYREFGIKGSVDIDFESHEQQNAAYIFTTLLEKLIWIQTSQESLNIFGTSLMQDIKKEPEPIQEFYQDVLSSKQDFSGIDYLRRYHIPHLEQAYLQSLAEQSSPKIAPETEEEKIAQILEEKMSPSVYKDWQVAAVITRTYEDIREKIKLELEK